MKDLTNLEIRDYLAILWRRRWYSIIFFVLVASGVSVYAFRMPDIFKSETRVVVESPMVSEDYVRPTVRATPEDRINWIREQLASRTFLERIIEQLQMYGFGARRDFVMENAVRTARSQIGIEKTSNTTFTISFMATDPQFAQTVTKQLAQELIRISSSAKKDKVLATDQFIDDQLRQATAALAAQEEKIKEFKTAHLGELPEQGNANANALAGLHSQLTAAESAIQQAQERQKLLDFKWQEHKRLNLLSQSVAATDSMVKSAEKKPTPPSPAELELAAKKELLAQYMTKYTPRHPDVVNLTREVDRLEQQIRQSKAAAAEIKPSEEASGDARKAAQPNNADTGDPMETSFQFEADGIKAELAKREKEKSEILRQIKLYQSRLNLAPALEQEMATLLREEDVLKGQCDNLQKQKFSAQLATTVETDKKNETYRIIDEASLPVKPEYPNRLQIILMGVGGGLLVGIGAAFGRELMDTTIGSEEDAKRMLDLPVLVTIPALPKEKKRKKRRSETSALSEYDEVFDLIKQIEAAERRKKKSVTVPAAELHAGPRVDDSIRREPVPLDVRAGGAAKIDLRRASYQIRNVLDPLTMVGEQVRLLRSRLNLMQKQRGTRTLLVTSSVLEEGKTFISLGMAGVFAQEQGKRILVIDADMRKAGSGRDFGFRASSNLAGMSQVLRGELEFNDALLMSEDHQLFFMPSGPLPSNPLELLSSPRLERILKTAAESFGWVIIDSPPAMALSDATLLSPLCDAVLLVVRANSTSSKLVMDTIGRIGKDKICGIVINRHKQIRSSRYFYQYYYRSSKRQKE
jgi:succinoglycan biosynthesis transport protein ExoP